MNLNYQLQQCTLNLSVEQIANKSDGTPFTPNEIFSVSDAVNYKRKPKTMVVNHLLSLYTPTDIDHENIDEAYHYLAYQLYKKLNKTSDAVLMLSLSESTTQMGKKIAEHLPAWQGKNAFFKHTSHIEPRLIIHTLENIDSDGLDNKSEKIHYLSKTLLANPFDTLVVLQDTADETSERKIQQAIIQMQEQGLGFKNVIRLTFVDMGNFADIALVKLKSMIVDTQSNDEGLKTSTIQQGIEHKENIQWAKAPPAYYFQEKSSLMHEKTLLQIPFDREYFLLSKLKGHKNRICVVSVGENHYVAEFTARQIKSLFHINADLCSMTYTSLEIGNAIHSKIQVGNRYLYNVDFDKYDYVAVVIPDAQPNSALKEFAKTYPNVVILTGFKDC